MSHFFLFIIPLSPHVSSFSLICYVGMQSISQHEMYEIE